MDQSELGSRTMAKVSRHFIPILLLMYIVNFLDRVNIGFAALQMNRDLGLSPAQFGFAAGILFIPYALAEVPSNLILVKVGARIWISRIMISWGIITVCHVFVYDMYSLNVMRFLLGLAEAGFSPGILLFLLYWFPARDRAKAFTLFLVGNPISVLLGAPISTSILGLDGVWGIAGWKWLFILEGFPAVIIGVLTLKWLTNSPEEAKWLKPDERVWLVETLAAETRAKHDEKFASWVYAFKHAPTLLCALAKLFILIAFFGITLWLPQIVKAMGKESMTNLQVGLITAIPYVFSVVISLWVARRSDRSGERTYHIAVPAFIGGAGFVLSIVTTSPYMQMVGLCIATAGIFTANTILWAIPASILSGTAAAVGFALINAVGNIGGFFGPYLTGLIRSLTQSFSWSLIMLGGFAVMCGLIVIFIAKRYMPSAREG